MDNQVEFSLNDVVSDRIRDNDGFRDRLPEEVIYLNEEQKASFCSYYASSSEKMNRLLRRYIFSPRSCPRVNLALGSYLPRMVFIGNEYRASVGQDCRAEEQWVRQTLKENLS